MAHDAGWMPEYVCGVPASWVPEHDVFDPKTGKQLARGWRSIVLLLVRRGFTTIDRARKVFAPSLGESAYDRLTIEEKSLLVCKPESAVDKARSLQGLSYAELKARL
jgi:hypothetical protein